MAHFGERMKELRANEETRNAGKPWKTEEDETLDGMLDDILSSEEGSSFRILSSSDYEQIAKALQRTPGAIEARVKGKAVKLSLDNPEDDPQVAAAVYGLDPQDLIGEIAKYKSKKSATQKGTLKPRKKTEPAKAPNPQDEKYPVEERLDTLHSEVSELKSSFQTLRCDVLSMHLDLQAKIDTLSKIILNRI